ncbi:glycine dehydrogenase (decarboxylating) subunit 1 [uncultured archaeon]|nr:glycine dehydrogenase (decarboxylating) subunit 1 [uncultured archaeon]
MTYVPVSIEEKAAMLKAVGIHSTLELFKDIPESARLTKDIKLPPALTEYELIAHIKTLAEDGTIPADGRCFLGAGLYRHFIPSAAPKLAQQPAFLTAYTPYQAEVSQGTLQALFEYQTLMCELTGQEVSNATLYDGSTATTEAALMATRIAQRPQILVSQGVHPHVRGVLSTYGANTNHPVTEIPLKDGATNPQTIANAITPQTGAIVIQHPNFLGHTEDVQQISKIAHEKGALLIVSVLEATSMGLLAPPTEADIVAGEGQTLGLPLNFGGPHFGFLTTKMSFVRQMPGRLVGETVDADGKRAYVLTLQAREQHIRREKALSNICTSQSLMAIQAVAHLALLGTKGFRHVAESSHRNAVYLRRNLIEKAGWEAPFNRPFYNEFILTPPKGALERLTEAGFQPGLPIAQKEYPRGLLVATTELHTKGDLDSYIEAATEAAK